MSGKVVKCRHTPRYCGSRGRWFESTQLYQRVHSPLIYPLIYPRYRAFTF